jgi:hypothetical protein
LVDLLALVSLQLDDTTKLLVFDNCAIATELLDKTKYKTKKKLRTGPTFLKAFRIF